MQVITGKTAGKNVDKKERQRLLKVAMGKISGDVEEDDES